MIFRNIISRFLCLQLCLVFIINSSASANGLLYSKPFFSSVYDSTEDASSINYCGPDYNVGPISSLSELNDVSNFKECFNFKKSYLNLGREPNENENRELILSDTRVCDCLRDYAKKYNPLEQAMKSGGQKKIDLNDLEIKYNKNLNRAMKEAGKLMFDASIICKGNIKCTSLYFQEPEDLKKSAPTKQNILLNQYKEKSKLDGEKLFSTLTEEQPLKPGQCVTAREFMAYNQKMSIEKISDELKNMDLNNFKPEDWDFIQLRNRYDQLMVKSAVEKIESEKEIESLRNKLIFLDSNPLIKNYFIMQTQQENATRNNMKDVARSFSAPAPATTPHDSNNGIPHQGTPGRSVSIRREIGVQMGLTKFLSDPEIKSNRSKLLGLLKDYVKEPQMSGGPQVCDISGSCMERIVSEDKFEDFSKKLVDFFHDPAVGRAVIEQSKQLMDYTLSRNISDEIPFEQKSLVTSFIEEYGDPSNPNQVMSPDSCGPDSYDEINCPRIYGGYCKKVDSVRHRIFLGRSQGIVDNLDDRLRDNFEMDIDLNPTFKKFNEEMCNTKFSTKKNESLTFNQYRAKNCSLKDKKLSDCRNDFYSKLSNPSENQKNFMKFSKYFSKIPPLSLGDLRKQSEKNYNLGVDPWVAFRKSWDLPDSTNEWYQNEGFSSGKSFNEESSKIDYTDSSENSSDKQNSNNALHPTNNFNFTPDYSTNAVAQAGVEDKKPEKQKIENMSDDKKRELLDDWQKDYDNWKKGKNVSDSDQLNPADKAREESYKREIESLKQLLEGQKKLTDYQSKLLNDKINKKTESESSTSLEKTGSKPRAASIERDFSPFTSTNSLSSPGQPDSPNRSPSSFSEPAKIGNSTNSSSAAKGSSGSARSSSLRSSESLDSLSREQAKLVNLRQYSDGSITVENVTGNATANAITLPVSDEQYRILLVNPTGLSLNQIEKNIPSEQINKLEKSGEIILLLKNGSNPPFEVKVTKVDNKLVYSLKDKNGNSQVPVKRVYTRQALENQLKVQR